MDHPPVVQVLYSPRPEINYKLLTCNVGLYRIPDNPPPQAPGSDWTYYSHQLGFGRDNLPIYGLTRTCHKPRQGIEGQMGNHLLLNPKSLESHLLIGERNAQAYIHPDHGVIFAFPSLGVQQTGTYVLQYTVSMIGFPQPLAKCLGAKFGIYSSSEFAGHTPSTPLTKSLTSMRVPGARARG